MSSPKADPPPHTHTHTHTPPPPIFTTNTPILSPSANCRLLTTLDILVHNDGWNQPRLHHVCFCSRAEVAVFYSNRRTAAPSSITPTLAKPESRVALLRMK